MLTHAAVYCGSASGLDPRFARDARRLGAALASRGVALVYGGGSRGLMGAVAEGALSAGGVVVGVITRQLVDTELAHPGVREMHVVDTMHQRKKIMADLAGAAIALPGGYGTLDELFEMLAWAQLGLHRAPIGVLNTAGFFDPLADFLDAAQAQGLLRIHPREAITWDDDPDRLVDTLAARSV